MALVFLRTVGFLFLWVGFSAGFSGSALASEESRVSFHGYGELHFNNPETGAGVPGPNDGAQMDFHRMVWGLSYQFDDRWSLHTEVDFEHSAGEIELELAYLDYLINPAVNLRAGAILMPVGPLNEFHEPTLFYSVERPQVQTTIIPTSWNEGGIGVYGGFLFGLKYRAYLVSGLDAGGFSADKGIRGGRSKVNEGPSEDLAGVGRLEYVGIPGLRIGASAYYGRADQDDPALGNVRVGIVEGDIRYQFKGADFQAGYTRVQIGNAEKIMKESCILQTVGAAPPFTVEEVCTSSPANIGEEMVGWSVEGAYDLLHPFRVGEKRLMAFARLEKLDTQEEVPAGRVADPENDRSVFTFGLAYFPIEDIAIKVDQERWKDRADNKEKRFNAGIAYMF